MYRFCSFCGSNLKLNKQGNLFCQKCGFKNYRNPRPTATALVLYRQKLLLVRRARPPFKGWWDLPGGFIDRGESSETAVKRELEEETGLKIKIKKLFGIYPGTYPSAREPFYILSIVYLAESKTQSLKALDDVAESRWFAKKDLPRRIAFDSNRKVINDLLKRHAR